uniref:Major facilitator superfamily transporter multidrug resistance n=1 Tax=Colletotrichum fructicola (strain Nara gc5) TaxID=1213859 RepID=L2FR01_COLFN
MARITDLPPEIIESILWSLDSVRSLIAALRSCRRFYAFVQQSEKIATGILRRKISPDILPYVAALEASYLCDDFPDVILKLIEPRHDDPDAPSGESDESNSESEVELEDFEEPLDDIEGSLDEFDDFDTESSDSFPGRRAFKFDCFLAARKLLKMLYDQPSALVDIILPPVPIFDLHVVERRYDKFSKIATDFAGFAWERLSEIDGGVPQEVTLSSAEHDRFCRAIYRLEIFYVLYNIMERNGNTVYDWFFLRHSPWENEQMACIYHFLEMRFTRNTHEVFAHDLSQGIEYIDDVTMQHDYESKKRMLETTDGVHYAHFPEVLCGIEPQMFSIDYWRRSWRMTFADGATIITTKEGVLSRVLREEDKDHDLGPRESWIAANLGMRKCKHTNRAITLDSGLIVIKDIEDTAKITINQWLCVEKNGYFGFQHPSSGRYMGHGGNKSLRAKATELNNWELFTPREHPKGGYQLLSPYCMWSQALMVLCVDEDRKTVVRRNHGTTLWEFMKV